MRTLIVVCAGLALSCSVWAKQPDKALLAKATKAITDQLKDPYSAKIEGVYLSANPGTPIVCGTVNAKNEFGAYTGRKPFYYFASSESPKAVIQGMSDMEHTIPVLCPQ
jgi:hypothetical protein